MSYRRYYGQLRKDMLQVVNPVYYKGWNEAVSEFSDCTVFHSSEWVKTLQETYGYRPVFFIDRSGSGVNSVYPFMEVESRLTGKRGVSFPFTDFIRPLKSCENYLLKDVDRIICEYAREHKWRYIDTKGWIDEPSDWTGKCQRCFEHSIDLSLGESVLYTKFTNKTKQNIRKAERSGVRIEISDTEESAAIFYELNCRTRRYHGLPPQPRSFFKNLYEFMIKKDLGFFVLAYIDSIPASGAVFLLHGSKAYYKYGATNRRLQWCRPNNLLFWESIKHLVDIGFDSLSLGATSTWNYGLMRFKNGWAADREERMYKRFDISKNIYTEYQSLVKGLHNHVFRRLPLAITRSIGGMFYKHMG